MRTTMGGGSDDDINWSQVAMPTIDDDLSGSTESEVSALSHQNMHFLLLLAHILTRA
jgi:hypothetical protein